MKKSFTRVISLLLCLTLFFFADAALLNNASAALLSPSEIVDAASKAFDSAEDIYQKITAMINEQREEEEGEGDGFEPHAPDIGESEKIIEELEGYIERLQNLISDISSLPDETDSSEGKTVRAVKDYLAMLSDIVSVMAEGSRYGIDLFKTMEAMDIGDGGFSSISAMAQTCSGAAQKALSIMEPVTPPVFLEATHGDLMTHIYEFEKFAEDFVYAANLDDPLRIYSSIYRLRRINMMFGKCFDNLNSDSEAQSAQMKAHLNGPVMVLHDELSANLKLLKGGE